MAAATTAASTVVTARMCGDDAGAAAAAATGVDAAAGSSAADALAEAAAGEVSRRPPARPRLSAAARAVRNALSCGLSAASSRISPARPGGDTLWLLMVADALRLISADSAGLLVA